MPFSQQSGLRYYTFEIFPKNISQAVFTRQGGVSPRPYDSLNVGGAIGDDIAHIRENRIRSFKALERVPAPIPRSPSKSGVRPTWSRVVWVSSASKFSADWRGPVWSVR